MMLLVFCAPKTNNIINQPAIASQTQCTELRYGTVNRAMTWDSARAGLGPKLSHTFTIILLSFISVKYSYPSIPFLIAPLSSFLNYNARL